MFKQLIKEIKSLSIGDFKYATGEIKSLINEMPEEDFKEIVKHIGIIPEDIEHDSTEEKLYSKTSDIVLARKNQKDFKVSNLSDWRGAENEYAVLVAPYFQYPQSTSQIYSKALDNNVCLLAWEHISILLKNNVKETSSLSLESLWNASQMMRNVVFYPKWMHMWQRKSECQIQIIGIYCKTIKG